MADVFGGDDLTFEDVEEVDDPNDDDFEWDDEEVVDEDESVGDAEDAEESEAEVEDAEESEAEVEDKVEDVDAEESEAEVEDAESEDGDDFSDWGFGEGDDDWEDPEEDEDPEEEDAPEDEEEDTPEDEDEDPEEDTPEDEDEDPSGYSDAEDDTDWVSDGNTQIAQGTSLESAIKGISGGFKITRGRIAIPSDLALLEFVKESRNETHQGLTQSIQEMGQLTPLVVMQSTSYAMYLAEHEGDPEGFEGKKYILIDGLRRLYSMVKLRFDYAEVCVFEFEDPDKGSEVAPLLRCLLNKHENMSYTELWGYLRILDEAYTLAPNIEEYLLGLESGDVMKLKDVMSSQDRYPDIVDALLSKKKTLDQAFSALNKARKEEDRLSIEDESGVGQIEDTAGIVDDSVRSGLSESDVKDILEMNANSDPSATGIDSDDFRDAEGVDAGKIADDFKTQDVNNREILDPAIKQQVFARDKMHCVICGIGGGGFVGSLCIHHIVEVKFGGSDRFDQDIRSEKNNLITLCSNCHVNLHYIAWNGNRLPLTESEYNEYTDEQKLTLRKQKHYANIVYECEQRYNRQHGIKQGDRQGRKPSHQMPGTNKKELEAALEQVRREESEGGQVDVNYEQPLESPATTEGEAAPGAFSEGEEGYDPEFDE